MWSNFIWHHRQVVRQRSAKPSLTSSNLVGASKISRSGEMADAQDSKSCDSNIMSVRPRPSGPLENTSLCTCVFYFLKG